ncbi:MAG: alginate lyase family protein, partial [Phycisphaeraceae bacterium]
MSSAARTLRTAMHLRPAQVWYRLGRKVGSLLPRRPLVCPASPVPSAALFLPPDMPEAGAPEGDAERWLSQMEQGTFTHLGQAQQLATDEQMDWRLGPVSHDRLWTITLHYHAWAERLAELVARDDQLSDRADAVLRRYLTDWLDHCDLEQEGAGQLAWNAYAIATRIGHWAQLWHRLGERRRQQWGDALEQRFLQSLWKQGAFLARNIEWDLRANHLMRDAVGLAWAGRFFEGDEPQRWLAAATQLAADQASEQVLPDGGHFERSPMYHLHIMEDLATLARLIEDPAVVQQLRETWQRMTTFAAWARHPDGDIPLLNDAAFNGCPSPSHALKQAPTQNGGGVGGRYFEDFGLFVHHSPLWSVFFDVGPVGVDYQPGHAHADTLTFECSFQGKRLIVDPGTFAYDHDDRRAYDRSTAAHNTVCID